MIAKMFEPCATFEGVFYNFDKVAEGNAEFIEAVNFGPLEALNEVHPVDYTNYLEAVSALNKNVSEPQLHVAISAAGNSHDKEQLTKIAKAWLEKMGYGKQPYLLFFHPDTRNNHIHIVTTRIDHHGRKINSGFEHVRSIAALNQIMGVDEGKTAQKDLEKANSYRFSNIAQFRLILERQGYTIKDNELIKFGKKLAVLDPGKIGSKGPDQSRAFQLKAIFKKYSPLYDREGFADYLKTKMRVELVFHAKDGKPAYGYTVIDHVQKNVYKGGEIMPLKELTASRVPAPEKIHYSRESQQHISRLPDIPVHINISKDIDDEAIHGRRRKKKARVNQR